jgi:hypothetical protein
MSTSVGNAPWRKLRLIGPATYLLGLCVGAAGLLLCGCSDEKGEMAQIKNENPTDRTKDSQAAYLKNAATQKKGAPKR